MFLPNCWRTSPLSNWSYSTYDGTAVRFSVSSLSAIARAACDARLGRASVVAGLLDLDSFGHVIFSFSAPLLAGHPKASGACSQGQGVLFAGEPRNNNFAFRFVSWGDRKPGGCRLAGKQNPAVPPARRRLSELAVPARKGHQKRRLTREINEGERKRRARSPTAGLDGVDLRREFWLISSRLGI